MYLFENNAELENTSETALSDYLKHQNMKYLFTYHIQNA